VTTPQQQIENLYKALQAMQQLAEHQEETITKLKTTIAQQQVELKALKTHLKHRTPNKKT